jgi:hypothetical protein
MRRLALAAVAAASLVGGVAARNFVEHPAGSGRSVAVTEQKTSRRLSPLVTGPVNKTGVEYKGFAPGNRGVNVSLHAAIADVWNFDRAKPWVVGIPRVGGMEQRMPNRRSLSGREETNSIACIVSRQCRVGDESAIIFWNVFDRVNFEIPVPSEGRFSSSIDEGQLYIHWFCGDKDAMVGSVYPYPSSVRLDSGFTRVTDALPEQNALPPSKEGGSEDNKDSSSFPAALLALMGAALMAGSACLIRYAVDREGYVYVALVGVAFVVFCAGGSIIMLVLGFLPPEHNPLPTLTF